MALPPRGRAIAVLDAAAPPTVEEVPAVAPTPPLAPVGRLGTFAGPRARVAPTRTGAPQVRSRSAPRSDQAAALRLLLASGSAARTAVLAAEVLGLPRALREHGLEH
jgi:hypothetical protein